MTIVILYAVAIFMPSVLLVKNNRREWMGDLRNPGAIDALLALFEALFVFEVVERFGRTG